MTSEKAPELKQCPFCGETDYLERQHLDGTVRKPAYRIACDNCGASSRYTDHGDEYEVWNERRADVADAMVAVKPLEWVKQMTRDGRPQWIAPGTDACVTWMEGDVFRAFNAKQSFPLRLDALAAEQAWHEKRILSALQSPADASAALAERDNATWNAAIEACLSARHMWFEFNSEGEPTGGFCTVETYDPGGMRKYVSHKNIAALKREKPE